MSAALLVIRLLLAAVFGVAGVAKLLDRAGSRRALVDFGAPARLAGSLGVLLPAAELATAIALVPSASARWGALAAFALLLVFTAAIARTLLAGGAADCHCFGRLRVGAGGRPALGRNAALAAVSLPVAMTGPGLSVVTIPDALGWVGLAVLGAIAVVVVQAVLWLQLLRQHGRILVRLQALERLGPTVGDPAPDFVLPSLDGELVSLTELRRPGRPVLLAFVDPQCAPCDELLPDLAAWQRDRSDRLTIALVSRGDIQENEAKALGYGLQRVLLQQEREVATSYGSDGTPSALLIDRDGRIAAPLARGAEEIRDAVAAAGAEPAVAPPRGRAVDFQLATLGAASGGGR